MAEIMIDCPTCNGDGFVSFGDRHSENRKESCPQCGGRSKIDPETGVHPHTSAGPDGTLYAGEKSGAVVTVDPVVEAVRADLLRRSQLGLAKYGTPLSRTDLDLRAWLQHAYEENLDMANYLKRCIMELDCAKG